MYYYRSTSLSTLFIIIITNLSSHPSGSSSLSLSDSDIEDGGGALIVIDERGGADGVTVAWLESERDSKPIAPRSEVA